MAIQPRLQPRATVVLIVIVQIKLVIIGRSRKAERVLGLVVGADISGYFIITGIVTSIVTTLIFIVLAIEMSIVAMDYGSDALGLGRDRVEIAVVTAEDDTSINAISVIEPVFRQSLHTRTRTRTC